MTPGQTAQFQYLGVVTVCYHAVAGPSTLLLTLANVKLDITFLNDYRGFNEPTNELPSGIIAVPLSAKPKRTFKMEVTHLVDFPDGSKIPAHIAIRQLTPEDQMLLRSLGAAIQPSARIKQSQPSRDGIQVKQASKSPTIQSSEQPTRPKYLLRMDFDVWHLIFEGREATIKSSKGLQYVAFLLKNPKAGPLHAIDIVAKATLGEAQTNMAGSKSTGKTLQIEAGDRPMERSHSLDDAVVAKRIKAEEKKWEAVLDDEDATEPEKSEAQRKLIELEEFQNKHSSRSQSSAEKLVRAVRAAITRLHDQLAKARDEHKKPHPVLNAFAEHIAKYIITPSSRYTGRIHSGARAGLAGRFTYEPPDGVEWTS